MSIEEMVNGLGMSADLATSLTEVVARWKPTLDRQSGYVSVRPADRFIAAYFNRAHVDIVVDPMKAQAAVAAHPGTRLLPKQTSTTMYLRVSTGTLTPANITELVGVALAWRDLGTRWSGEHGSGLGADLAGETCQTCFTELAVNGTCSCD